MWHSTSEWRTASCDDMVTRREQWRRLWWKCVNQQTWWQATWKAQDNMVWYRKLMGEEAWQWIVWSEENGAWQNGVRRVYKVEHFIVSTRLFLWIYEGQWNEAHNDKYVKGLSVTWKRSSGRATCEFCLLDYGVNVSVADWNERFLLCLSDRLVFSCWGIINLSLLLVVSLRPH